MNGVANLSLPGLLGVMNSNSGRLGNEVLLLILANGLLLIFLSYVSFISAYSIPIIIIIIITIIIIISLCKKTLQQRCIDFDFQLCRAQATQWGWEGKGRIGLDQLPCLLVPQPMKDRHTSGGRGKDPEGGRTRKGVTTRDFYSPRGHLPPHRVR